ncbi:MAG: LapA family protein [Candidatus Nanopelagicales bacterium]
MADAERSPDRPASGPAREEHVYGKPPGTGDWKRISRLTALGVVIVYTVLFFLMNRDTIEVSLVVTTASIPLVWVLVGSFLLGVVATYLIGYLRRRRRPQGEG